MSQPIDGAPDNSVGGDHLDLNALADHLAEEHDATAHLSDCAGCSARLLELRAAELMVVATLSTLPAPTLPPDIAHRIALALAAEPRDAAEPPDAAEPGSPLGSVREGVLTDVPSGTVTPLEPRRHRRPWVPAVAAATSSTDIP